MAATNTTEFLGLGQYVANDKPSFLGTYNSDMRTIDEFAEDTSTRMGTVESQVTGATEDLSGVHESINTLNSEVNTLIEKTANLPQDETQINNNTSAINSINQSITNINGSITEILGDIADLDDKIKPLLIKAQDTEDDRFIAIGDKFNPSYEISVILYNIPGYTHKIYQTFPIMTTKTITISDTVLSIDNNGHLNKTEYNYNFNIVRHENTLEFVQINSKYGTITKTIYNIISDPDNPVNSLFNVANTTTTDINDFGINAIIYQN